ncbi:MAG: IS21 family transposase [Anaerolineae bacterium]
MSGRRAEVLDIREMLRQVRLGASDRSIGKAMQVSRKTVKKYREWAQKQGLLQGELPPTDQLLALLQSTLPETPPPQIESGVEPHRQLVEDWRVKGLEAQAIYQKLVKDHTFTGSYSAVWRFIHGLEPDQPEATVRVEVRPGDEGQVDFGYVGQLLDLGSGKLRKCWAFVMTLSWSRHMYVEFVFDQTVDTWLRLHRNAFACLGGVPKRIVLDNLKAAIIKASVEDPEVQRSYRELAEHYDFLIAPCRPRTPEHKGKVESGVHYVQRNFMAVCEPKDIPQANESVLDWIESWAGQRIHGTTKQKPLVRFREVEQAALLPLPDEPYDLAVWNQSVVGRDCYVNFDKAYYSAPERLRGHALWVRSGLKSVGIYEDYKLVALHPRAKEPGERHTILAHLPPAKVPGLTTTRESCATQAAAIGPDTAEVVRRLLADKPVDRLPSIKRLLKLEKRYGASRLECACTRALQFDEHSVATVRRILEKSLDLAALPPVVSAVLEAPQFARSADELWPGLGGVSWN